MTAGLPLTKNAITPLGESVLLPFGLSEAMWATHAAIQNKIYGSGHSSDFASRITGLIISNEEMEDIMKIVKSIEEWG